MAQERFTRAQPHELKTIRLRKKPLEKTKKQGIPLSIINAMRVNVIRQKERKKVKKPIKTTLDVTHTIACQTKKAKARHDYISMISSGKGTQNKRKNHDNRFDSRC